MLFIVHRRNTIEELQNTPFEYGVEIDIRSYGQRIIVGHEPFVDAIDLEAWLRHYRHALLILNLKEEGIEDRIKQIVEQEGIGNYFFLDLSFPALVRMVDLQERRLAVRLSDYESVETVMNFFGKAEWVWVDSFKKAPLSKDVYNRISEGFKLCLASPELQGRDVAEITQLKKLVSGFRIDAVCTKRPDLWK